MLKTTTTRRTARTILNEFNYIVSELENAAEKRGNFFFPNTCRSCNACVQGMCTTAAAIAQNQKRTFFSFQ